jgi:hypothetical protein
VPPLSAPDPHGDDPVTLWRGISDAEWDDIVDKGYKFAPHPLGDPLYLTEIRLVGESTAHKNRGLLVSVTLERSEYVAFFSSPGMYWHPKGIQMTVPQNRLDEFNRLYDVVVWHGYP